MTAIDPNVPITDNTFATKVQVVVVSTGNNLTLQGEQTIDGTAVLDGQRVLVRSQTDPIENGLYICRISTWGRAQDFVTNAIFDDSLEAERRMQVYVEGGNEYAGTIWELTNATRPTVGSDAVTFALNVPAISAIGVEETDPDGTEVFTIEDAGTPKFISLSNADEGMIISSTSDPTASDDSAGTAGNGECHVGRRWVNTVTNSLFVSADASTGGAIWVEVPYSSYANTTDPTTDDDSAGTGGNNPFDVGSVYINVTDDKVFTAVDVSSGAAVWREHLHTGYETLSTSGTIADTARTHWLSSTAPSQTVTLPSPTVRTGDEHILTNTSSSYSWTVSGSIDGSTAGTETIYPGESFSMKSDGTYWRYSG